MFLEYTSCCERLPEHCTCEEGGPEKPEIESSFEIVDGVVTELDCPAPRIPLLGWPL